MNETCLRRLNQLLKHYHQSQEYQVGLDELELVLATSRRNASNILKALSDYGWITWNPGQGRGKASSLKVTISLHQALYQIIRRELKENNFHIISRLMESYQETAARALNQAMTDLPEEKVGSKSMSINEYPPVKILQPALSISFSERQVIYNLYDSLFRIGTNGHLRLHLACDYEIDGRYIYIWLRPDVHCHDGQLLSEADVIYSLNMLMQAKGPVSRLFRQVQQINYSQAKQAICIVLERPNPLFIYFLSTDRASIITHRRRDFSENYGVSVGTGPFVLEHWDRKKLVLKKHHGYFAKQALLEKITLFQGEEQDQREKIHCSQSHCSYLAHNRRLKCSLSEESWQTLFLFLESGRLEFTRNRQLEIIPVMNDSYRTTKNVPNLEGTLVLASSKRVDDCMIKWIVSLIKRTGLNVEHIELSGATQLQVAKQQADLLIEEERIAQPLAYGLYEWLISSMGIRFAVNEQQLEQHTERVYEATTKDNAIKCLMNIYSQLYDETFILPLFWREEPADYMQRKSGAPLSSSGYIEFYKIRPPATPIQPSCGDENLIKKSHFNSTRSG
ncbi:TPA: SgrR family transcriptional regulator [Vibrio campbellii]|nr:SgrR family transcriptional regulator [Vibrio campbellii]